MMENSSVALNGTLLEVTLGIQWDQQVLEQPAATSQVPAPHDYEAYKLTTGQEFIVTILLEKVFRLILTVVGLIGNGITIIILLDKHNRKSSTANYLTALAVSDIVIVLFGPFLDWLEIMSHDITKEYGTFACKLQTFMQYSSSSTSSWLLAAVTVEKAAGVVFPYQVHSALNNRKRTFIVIAIIWTVMYAVNLHFMFGMGHGYNKVCYDIVDINMHFSMYILPWIKFSLCFATPFLCISTGNVVIIRQLAVAQARRKNLTKSKLHKHLAVLRILVTVNIMYIISVGPIYIFSALLPHVIDNIRPQQIVNIKRFWGPLLDGLWEMNSAMNMVLYILSGSKFRKEVIYLLRCSKKTSTSGIFDHSLPGNGSRTPVFLRKHFRRHNSSNHEEAELKPFKMMAPAVA